MILSRFLKRLFGYRSSPKWGKPTDSQIDYLQKLIKINNRYRAHPRILNDWIETYCKGKWNFWRASNLIKKLRFENSEKRIEFSANIRKGQDRKSSGVLHASDFSTYGFCPNAFYLKYRGFANRNLYELSQGRFYHGESAEPGYINQNSELLRNKIDRKQKVSWFKPGDCESLYDTETGLSGIPDGLITFEHGEVSVVEVKFIERQDITIPFDGDIMQACAYVKLCRNSNRFESSRVSSRMFLIYVNRDARNRQLFEEDYGDYEESFQSTLKQMKETSFTKTLYQSRENRNKCPKCGYRALCASSK